MKKIISWIMTIPYVSVFFLILVLCHPIVWISSFLGIRFVDRASLLLTTLLQWNLKILGGTTYHVHSHGDEKFTSPTIFVSNHQSMYDIPLLITVLSSSRLRFVSKKELARGIPSISILLRLQHSALIDRSNRHQALAEIKKLATYMNENHVSACIFPEGTRAKDGILKKFRLAGFSALFQALPEADVVPVAIDGTWKILEHGFRPLGWGNTVSLHVFKPLERNGKNASEVLSEAQKVISTALEQGGTEIVLAPSVQSVASES